MLGTVQAMRRHQDNTKLLMLDHSQRKSSRVAKAKNENIDQLALSYLSGKVPLYGHLKCLDVEQDVCIFGGSPLQDPHNTQYVRPSNYKGENISEFLDTLESHFESQPNATANFKYWLSINATSFDPSDFTSVTSQNKSGLSMEFVMKLLQKFAIRSHGVDLSEINFEKCDAHTRTNDEQVFREIIETIYHSVNQQSCSESVENYNIYT